MTFTLYDSLFAEQRRAHDGGPLVATYPVDDELWSSSMDQVGHRGVTTAYAWTHRRAYTLLDPWGGDQAWTSAPRAVLPGSEGAQSDRPRTPAPAGSIWRGRTGRDSQWWHVLVDAQPDGQGTFVSITRDHDTGRVWCDVSGGGPAAYPEGTPTGALPGTEADLYAGVPTLAETPPEVLTVDGAAGRMLADVLRAQLRRRMASSQRQVEVTVEQTMAGAPEHHAAVVLALGGTLSCGDDERAMRAAIVERLWTGDRLR